MTFSHPSQELSGNTTQSTEHLEYKQTNVNACKCGSSYFHVFTKSAKHDMSIVIIHDIAKKIHRRIRKNKVANKHMHLSLIGAAPNTLRVSVSGANLSVSGAT